VPIKNGINILLDMIKFNKSATNNVIVTLKENSTVLNPIYLFKFVSQQTLVSYYFIGSDISSYKDRFNKFTIIEKASANTLNGEVTLGKEGFYDYKVYQTNLANTSGLANAEAAVGNITKEVEDGLVYVVFAVNNDIVFDTPDDTTIVYQP
jgi:hypothetical protein